MKLYKVIVTREEDAWLADVPALTGTHTWAKNLPTLDRNVREAIALAEDLPEGAEESLRLTWTYLTGDPTLDAEAAEVRAARIELAERETRVAIRTIALIQDLSARGYSVRDTARLVGVAPQRVSQIAPRAARQLRSGPRNPTPPPVKTGD
jgi:hypothetical protein